jgi:hypothetical protein
MLTSIFRKNPIKTTTKSIINSIHLKCTDLNEERVFQYAKDTKKRHTDRVYVS